MTQGVEFVEAAQLAGVFAPAPEAIESLRQSSGGYVPTLYDSHYRANLNAGAMSGGRSVY